MALDPEALNPTDRAILDELQRGRVTPAFVAEQHGYSTGNVRNRMTHLASHDHVRALGGGLYELVDDPRSPGDDRDYFLRVSPDEAEDAVLLAEYANEDNGPPEARRWAERLRERVLNGGEDPTDAE